MDAREAALQLILAVDEAIQEGGPIAEGPLYAMLMGLVPGLTLEMFTELVDFLVNANRVRKVGHLLVPIARGVL